MSSAVVTGIPSAGGFRTPVFRLPPESVHHRTHGIDADRAAMVDAWTRLDRQEPVPQCIPEYLLEIFHGRAQVERIFSRFRLKHCKDAALTWSRLIVGGFPRNRVCHDREGIACFTGIRRVPNVDSQSPDFRPS